MRHQGRIALASLCLFFSLQLSFIWMAQKLGGIDFAQFYVANHTLKEGRGLYTMNQQQWESQWSKYVDFAPQHGNEPAYIYPPTLAILISPLTTLYWRTDLLLWRALNVLIFAISASVLSLLLADRLVDPLVFTVAAVWTPSYANLYAGNTNGLVLLSIVLFLFFASRFRSDAAGLALSAGLAIKPYEAPLLIYLGWRREWRKLLAVLIGLVVILGIIIAPLNWHNLVEYWRTGAWLSWVAPPLGPAVWFAHPRIQSFYAFFYRAFTANPYGSSIANSVTVARLLTLLASSSLLLIIAYLTWPRREEEPRTFALQVGLVIAAMPLVEAFGEYFHLMVVIVPFLLCWYATASRVRRGVLIAALLLIDVQGVFWSDLVGRTPLLSLGTYGMVLIFCVAASSLHGLQMTRFVEDVGE